MSLIPVYKEIGITPLELVNKVKEERGIRDKISYLGRLDPMAHGLMVLLSGNETKNQETYQKLDKVYRFKVLFGISTDTYDILGIPKENKIPKNIEKHELKTYLDSIVGKTVQKFPPYSSIKVKGKPLWYWSKNGMLDSVTIPKKEINIYYAKLLDYYAIESNDLLANVKKNISRLNPKHDFRQTEILDSWSKIKKGQYYVASCEAKVSTGTYIRDISNTMGKYFGDGAIAYDILRTTVGDYDLDLSLDLSL